MQDEASTIADTPILSAAGIVPLASTQAPTFAADDTVVVRVKAGDHVGPVSPYLTGANNDQFGSNSHGLWDAAAGRHPR